MGITILPLSVSFGEDEYLDGINLNSKDFFMMLENSKEFPHTSQLSSEKYKNVFQEAVKKVMKLSVSHYLANFQDLTPMLY